MRVLFLYPNKVMITRVPVGVCYLSAYLKRDGHQVKLFDTTFIKCGNIQNDEELRASALQVRNPDLKKYGLVERDADPVVEFEREIELFKPDIIAASVVDPNYSFSLELLREIRKKYKDIVTVVGGPTATFAPEEVIAEDCVDIVCRGEGEEALTELCNNIEQKRDIKDIKNLWIKENGKIYKNEVRPLLDINKILRPDWSIFDERHILKPLAGKIYRIGHFGMTRGCLFPCKYCANRAKSQIYKDKGEYYRIKRTELLVQEMAFFKEKYNLNFNMFFDDLFPLHKHEVAENFCKLYKKHVGLPFTINLHPELIKEEQFSKIVEAGCRNICVGLESGSPKVRRNVLGRNYKNEQVVRVIGLARKYKIRSSTFDMIGIPYETRKEIFETIELNRQAKPTTTTLTFFHPYRGTELRDLCIKEKLFDPIKEKEYENVYRAESCLDLNQISNKELRGLFRTFQLYFKLPKIYYGLIRIAEGETFLANSVFNILKRIFYRITEKESKWDFKRISEKGNS